MSRVKRKKKRQRKFLLKSIIMVGLAAYVCYVFVCQQMMLNSYKTNKEQIQAQIAQKEDELANLKANQSTYESDAYIETVARERLGFVAPDERVYIDASGK